MSDDADARFEHDAAILCQQIEIAHDTKAICTRIDTLVARLLRQDDNDRNP